MRRATGVMTRWTRRQFGSLAAGAGLAVAAPRISLGQGRPRVLLLGGGVGGIVAGRALAMSGTTIDVTLVEPKRRYTTCFFSNLYLAGLRSIETISFGYETLATRHGITIIHDAAVSVDAIARKVALSSGATLAYDRLVVSPGIAFRPGAIEGYDEAAQAIMPHAWNAGPQTLLLRRQLESIPDGGVFAIAVPANPYRCPPAPYERASLAAYYFKQFKPRTKILILDGKDSYFEQDLFEDAWRRHYRDMIEWLPAQFTGGVKAVDVRDRALMTPGQRYKADVINVIPPQMAGMLAQRAGLADESGWCPVDPSTFQSTIHDGIHVLGDAAHAGAMPKSAFAAESQAKVCAAAIVAALTGAKAPVPRLSGQCYTILAADDAVSSTSLFKVAAGGVELSDIDVSQVSERAETRRKTMQDANAWYTAFTRDLFD